MDPEFQFTADKAEEEVLFDLWFTQPTDVIEQAGLIDAKIYTVGQTLYMEFGSEAGGRELEIYDTSGRLLMQKPLGGGTHFTQQLDLQTGVYIVRILGEKQVQTQRIILNR